MAYRARLSTGRDPAFAPSWPAVAAPAERIHLILPAMDYRGGNIIQYDTICSLYIYICSIYVA